MKSTVGKNHPESIQAKLEIEQLKKKISSIYSNATESGFSSGTNDRLFPLFSDIPELGKYYIRAERELTVQTLIFTFITQELEKAKIEEARDTPTVQVIDIAIPPIKKHRPLRVLLVLFATFTSSLFYIAIILGKYSFKEFLHNIKN